MIGVSKIYEKSQCSKIFICLIFTERQIGVIGLNGSGKSSLLKILSGVDTDYLGKQSFPLVIQWAIWSRNRVWTKTKLCGKLWNKVCKAPWT